MRLPQRHGADTTWRTKAATLLSTLNPYFCKGGFFMSRWKFVLLACMAGFVILTTAPLPEVLAEPQQTRLLRYPDYHNGLLAFCYLGDIWVLDEGKGALRPLTHHEAVDIRPKFSPDGKWLAFSSNRSGNFDIYAMPVEGGTPKRLTCHSASDVVVTWTPDSKYVVFRSLRGKHMGRELYKVSLEAELPQKLPCGTVSTGTFHSSGRYIAINRRNPSYQRKGYRGTNNTEVWVFDFQEKKFSRLTDFDGHDNSPMFSGDDIYFVSNRDGTFNIWKVPMAGGDPVQVTSHKGEGSLYPSISSDGGTIVYERNFELYKLQTRNGKYAPARIALKTDYIENPHAYRKFSKVDDFDISHDGKRVAFCTHGEIFTIPVEKGRAVQLTDSPARDRRVCYDPKSERVAFISDRTGEEQIYIINADGTGLGQLTDTETLKPEVAWSPDGEYLSVVESDNSLWIYNVEAKEGRRLIRPKEGRPFNVVWSPDGKWLAYARDNEDSWSDVYIMSAVNENPVEHAVLERMPYSEYRLQFTPEKLYFLGLINEDWEFAVYSVDLARQEVDPDDPEAKAKKNAQKKKEKEKPPEKKAPEKPAEGGATSTSDNTSAGGEAGKDAKLEDEGKPEKKEAGKKKPELPEVKIDFEGIEKRMKEIVRVPGRIRGLAVSPKGSDVVIVVNEPRGKETKTIIYSVLEDGKKLKQIGSGRDIRGIRFSPDGKNIYYTSAGVLFRMPKSGGSPKRVAFSVRVKVDRLGLYTELFNECWRIMKHTFYDPNMHGVDWDAVHQKYSAVLPSVTHKEALGTLVNKMLGELEASHIGFYVNTGDEAPSYRTMNPGFKLVPDDESGLYRVGHIYKKGPADKEWVDIKEGDYILSVDGEELKVPQNYWKIFNHPLNERVDIVVSAEMQGEKRTSTVKLASNREISRYDYYEKVDARREQVEELSGGRLAYICIPSMSGRSLERFKREIIEFRLKEGLIIDVRNNPGGNIDQELLDVLERGTFGTYGSRNEVPRRRPYNAFPGPKVVLINQYSFSDAEVFPMGFASLGLGKVIGVPTAGGVIGTGSRRLIDGSVMRTPVQGYYTEEGVNLENSGVKPDIYVELPPGDELAGRDPQLERAVSELLSELGGLRPKK